MFTRRLRTLSTGLLAAALLLGPVVSPVEAQERVGATLELGLGARVAPDFPGSDSYRVNPTGIFGFRELRLPGGMTVGTPDARPLDPGFGVSGSARYISARGPGRHPQLTGLERVDASLELGLSVRHVAETWRVYADLRHGVVGHGGWAGDLGADAILRLGPRWTVNAGPRASFGDARFKRTYFGVTPSEADASGFSAFRPSGGLVSVGAEVEVRHDISDLWAVIGTLSYDRLRGDAGRSPVTAQGSRDQWGARIVVTRRFNFRF
ncbi:MipA/OmpV family protein [Rhodobaculum claviforme]|nr:MipA/OmpV family protein [Rhodobaculum claviforme]